MHGIFIHISKCLDDFSKLFAADFLVNQVENPDTMINMCSSNYTYITALKFKYYG